MNSIEKLKQEHEEIERELAELELIMQEDIINYPNLLHVLKLFLNVGISMNKKKKEFFQF